MFRDASRGWFLAMALGITLGAATACSAAPAGEGSKTMIPAPPGTVAELGAAQGDPAAKALAAWAQARVGAGRTIATARYFRTQPVIAWNAVSTFVAGQRAEGGRPPKPRFVDGGLDLIDVYPAAGKKPAFAVAMARDAAPDGTKLVGYFDLKD